VSRFVCALPVADLTHGAGPTLFRSYQLAKNRGFNCKIWEAARATTAAPTFFKRIEIGNKGSAAGYIDAGVGSYNSPIRQMVAEAARVFGDSAVVDCIVSIVTGEAQSTEYGAPSVFQNFVPTELVGVLGSIVTNCSATAQDMVDRFRDEDVADI
jgi:patatin-like phospholipase/acyl hydrolase